MIEAKTDDRAYYHDQFYRHGVFKSGSSCLQFPQNYAYFRRHDDVLKRLSCLQLNFQSSLAIGMMPDFSDQRACTCKFHMTSERHDDGFHHTACLCCIKTATNGYDTNGKRGPGSNAHVLSNMA